jgi:Trypsin-like peptidase domain
MPGIYTPPTGRLNTRRRQFEEVVRDIRYTVFAVIRLRPAANGTHNCMALGSGFFVSREVFLTCHHVVNAVNAPHVDGDIYRFVAVTDAKGAGNGLQIPDVKVGESLHLFPDSDLALFRCPILDTRPFVALEYGEAPLGKDVGVAGYPLPQLAPAPGNGDLRYDGLIFRVARGPLTSTYITALNNEQGMVLQNVPILEVNFLFVPGNSGGPVFDAETGRVAAFVQGYRTAKIRERVETVTMINPLPQGLGNTYVENLSALYSIAIKIERARPHLEAHGVTL